MLKSESKLVLRKTELRILNEGELGWVAGGGKAADAIYEPDTGGDTTAMGPVANDPPLGSDLPGIPLTANCPNGGGPAY